jgi:hypothetical protein
MISAVRVKDNPAPTPNPPAPAPPAAADVDVMYNSQDQYVMPAEPTTIQGVTVNANGAPETDKTALATPLAPNADGKYVYADCDPNHTAALSFAASSKTVATISQAFGAPVQWAFDGGKLQINADEGEDFNAYYSRDSGGIHFFHGTDPITQEYVMSGDSGEVVSHETGHAILDGLRPAYLSSWTPDVGAFHESFGDMMGIFMSFQDERTLNRVVVQTGGDLSKQNCIAATGEKLGVAINDYVGSNDTTGGDYVRNAKNDFKWADPATLPDGGGPTQLGSEVHSFSRLWTGAMYEILTGIQAQNMAAGQDPKSALQATGQEGLQMYANLMKVAPQGDFTYNDMAKALIAGDQQFNNGKNVDLITKVMTDRGILQSGAPDPTPTPNPDPNPPSPVLHNTSIFTSTTAGRKPLADVTRPVTVRLSGPEFGMFQGAKTEILVDRDGSLSKDAETTQRAKANIARLVKQGKIRYNDPNYQMKKEDYFDPKTRQPYAGVVRWVNGEMYIERVKIAT